MSAFERAWDFLKAASPLYPNMQPEEVEEAVTQRPPTHSMQSEIDYLAQTNPEHMKRLANNHEYYGGQRPKMRGYPDNPYMYYDDNQGFSRMMTMEEYLNQFKPKQDAYGVRITYSN